MLEHFDGQLVFDGANMHPQNEQLQLDLSGALGEVMLDGAEISLD